MWSYPLAKSKTNNGVYGSVAIAGGRIYSTSGDGALTCFDLAGNFQWNASTFYYHGQSSSPTVANGKVFVGCDSQPRLFSFNATTGSTAWVYTDSVTMNGIYSSPAVSGGRIYFGTDTCKVTCIPETDSNGDKKISGSEVIWNVTMPDKVWSSPTVTGGNVFIGCGDANTAGTNVFSCLDADDGSVVWIYPTSGNIGDILSTPVVSGGFVYFGATNGNVYCLDEISGAKVWNTPLPSPIWSSPALAYGRIFIGCNDGRLYCLDASTGVKIWDYLSGGQVWSAPSVADGKVIFGSCDRKLYCLDALLNTASLVWSTNMAPGGGANGVPASPTIYQGLLYIGGWNATMPRLFCFGPAVFEMQAPIIAVSLLVIAMPAGRTVWKRTI
jgi:outer membrane protein assembly factor BamB